MPNFTSSYNLKGMLLAVSTAGMVSCTMLFCLASGNFDLSVGTVVPCAGVMAAIGHRKDWQLFAGPACGLRRPVHRLFNGFIVAVCRINPLITTLATMQIVKTLTFKISDGKSIGVANDAFSCLARLLFSASRRRSGFASLAFSFSDFCLNRTTFGRNTLAIGGNEEAARLAGIAVPRTKMTVFAMQGLIAAFAGIVLAGRMKADNRNHPKDSSLK